jgi:DNA-binding NarL/FixJ family response regulator
MNKIIIVDDHVLFREGIELLIENENLGNVVAKAENGEIFLNLLKIHKPDLVIMDLEMPVMGGLEATQKAIELNPELKVLILTMFNEKLNIPEILDAGACGIALKTLGKDEFEKSIKCVLAGKRYFSEELMLLISQKQTGHLYSRI